MADSFSTAASSDGFTVELPQAGEGTKGRPFGDYVVEREVARGGMGIVYRALRKDNGAVVALKIIKQGPQASPRQVRRFQRETEAARILEHPGIVRIYEVGCCEGYHFYTMELVEGESLYALLKRKQRLDVNVAIEMVALSAEAAHYAHEMGVVHRDLKPANILLTLDGKPKLTDFGLAKRVSAKSHLRRTDHVVGTPYYMPPEQARGDMDLDRRADVYALGVILYELLALRVPFQGTTSMEVYQHVLNTNPPSLRELDPRVDEKLERIVFQTLAKDLGDRYATALEFAEDLRRYMGGQAVAAKAPAWERKRTARIRRRIALWGGLVIVAAVAAVFVFRSQNPQPVDPVDPPQTNDALAAETELREAFETARGELEGLFKEPTLAGLAAAEGKLAKVAAVVEKLRAGGDSWQERSADLESARAQAAARLALALADVRGPQADWTAVAAQLGELDATDNALQVMRARALVGADQLDEAAKLLEGVLTRDPYDQAAALAQVELDLWRGELESAQNSLKAILTQDPDSAPALELATQLALRRGILREAQSHLDAWGRSASRDPHVHWQRALIGWEASDSAIVRASLKRLGGADQPRARAADAVLKLLAEDWAGAEEGFKAALELDPGLAPASFGVAVAQRGAGQRERPLETLAALAKRTDPRGRWLRSRAEALAGRLQIVPAWSESAAGGDSPNAARAREHFARAAKHQPVSAEVFRGQLELAWIERDEDRLNETLTAARGHVGGDAIDPWAETQPEAEPGLGWLSCWEGEVRRLAGDGKAARRAFAQVRSGPSTRWASEGRDAAREAPPALEFKPATPPPAWLGPLLSRSPAVFPRDDLAQLARAGKWAEVVAALETLGASPAPRTAASRWLGMIFLGARMPGLEDAPEVPADLRDTERGAELLLKSLEAEAIDWADYGRALIAQAKGEQAKALELAERDAEARPTASGWRLVAQLKRAQGDEKGATAAEQRAQSLSSQQR